MFADPDLIYLDGNSLGRLPEATKDVVAASVSVEWGDRLIRSWNEGWWELQLRLGDLLAPVVGARPGEMLISDATSVNLFKLAHSAVAARSGRTKIVTDDLNFPTDVYVLNAVARMFPELEVTVVPSDGIHGPVDELADAVDNDTALVSLSHTTFKSGFTYDMKGITSLAHGAGALMLWDCSHSVGVIPTDFTSSGVDLAVGCTYKYLNGGPGSPAFLYVRESLQSELGNPISAWWGHEDPFAFDLDFRPTQGIRRFHTGTMPILSLAAIEPGINDVLEAGVESIRTKSESLSSFLVDLVDSELVGAGFEIRSPRDGDLRGSHVSLGHSDAWPIARALIDDAKVIPDFRAPDNLRLGLAPLYTSHVDVHTAVHRIRQVVTTGTFLGYRDSTADVT